VNNPIGPLTAADESFTHQIPDTFAVVGSHDLAWTEKVCAMAAARDGSLQLGFGLGKYTNRNVIDGYGGVSRGKEQITVRASRRLSDDPEHTVMGPLRYEVVEPLKKIRFVLEPNDCQPIAFDWLFECVVPPLMEGRTHNRVGYRTAIDLVRYHQAGVCSGWIEIDGVRTEMTPDTWVSTRDHSWGVRQDVGLPRTDVEASALPPNARFEFYWSPITLERPDGSRYALFIEYLDIRAPGFGRHVAGGAIEHPDGRREEIVEIAPDGRFDASNRRLLGVTFTCTMADGSTRPLTFEVLGDTGFHLGAGLYFGFDGHHHGEWRGALHVDGERITDCTTPEQARRLHQIRDTVVRVHDPVGGGTGWGNCQPIMTDTDYPFM